MFSYHEKFKLLAFSLLYLSILFLSQPANAQDKTSAFSEPELITPGKKRKPPSDAIILFEKSALNNFESIKTGGVPDWSVSGRKFTVRPGTGNILTKEKFGDCQLHIEWKISPRDVSEGQTGQNSGNSGIYFMCKYEIQVLNSYENKTNPDGQAASFYGNFPPLVNASVKAGKWQCYDIVFMAPEFSNKEELTEPGYFTVFHNGVLVLNHVEVTAPTASHLEEYSLSESELPLMLQDHNNEVSYRNIWIRKL